MTRQHLTVISLAALTLLAGCKEKKTTTDIIAAPTVVTQPSGPIKMQTYNDQREVKWLGKSYSVEIDRQPSDSLPMVTDETGQQFVDNVIRLTIRRSDGSVAVSKKFLKTTFDRCGTRKRTALSKLNRSVLILSSPSRSSTPSRKSLNASSLSKSSLNAGSYVGSR